MMSEKLSVGDRMVLDKLAQRGRFKSWKKKREFETWLEREVNTRIEEAIVLSCLAVEARVQEAIGDLLKDSYCSWNTSDNCAHCALTELKKRLGGVFTVRAKAEDEKK